MKKTFKQTQPVSFEQALIALVKNPSKRFFAERDGTAYPYHTLFTNNAGDVGTDIVSRFDEKTTLFDGIGSEHRTVEWFEAIEVAPEEVEYANLVVHCNDSRVAKFEGKTPAYVRDNVTYVHTIFNDVNGDGTKLIAIYKNGVGFIEGAAE